MSSLSPLLPRALIRFQGTCAASTCSFCSCFTSRACAGWNAKATATTARQASGVRRRKRTLPAACWECPLRKATIRSADIARMMLWQPPAFDLGLKFWSHTSPSLRQGPIIPTPSEGVDNGLVIPKWDSNSQDYFDPFQGPPWYQKLPKNQIALATLL